MFTTMKRVKKLVHDHPRITSVFVGTAIGASIVACKRPPLIFGAELTNQLMSNGSAMIEYAPGHFCDLIDHAALPTK